MIFFNWILYNDNDQVKYENRSLLERFSKPTMNYTQGKSFVRGKLDNLIMPSSHIPRINIYIFVIRMEIFINNKFLITSIISEILIYLSFKFFWK